MKGKLQLKQQSPPTINRDGGILIKETSKRILQLDSMELWRACYSSLTQEHLTQPATCLNQTVTNQLQGGKKECEFMTTLMKHSSPKPTFLYNKSNKGQQIISKSTWLVQVTTKFHCGNQAILTVLLSLATPYILVAVRSKMIDLVAWEHSMDSQKSSSCALATVGTSCVDNNHTVHFTAAGFMLLCGKKLFFS